jgi:hypothetical protein
MQFHFRCKYRKQSVIARFGNNYAAAASAAGNKQIQFTNSRLQIGKNSAESGICNVGLAIFNHGNIRAGAPAKLGDFH